MKLKTFDAVAASKKWREETGRQLDALCLEERLVFLNGLRQRKTAADGIPSSYVVREDAVTFQTKNHPKP